MITQNAPHDCPCHSKIFCRNCSIASRLRLRFPRGAGDITVAVATKKSVQDSDCRPSRRPVTGPGWAGSGLRLSGGRGCGRGGPETWQKGRGGGCMDGEVCITLQRNAWKGIGWGLEGRPSVRQRRRSALSATASQARAWAARAAGLSTDHAQRRPKPRPI